jgi:guanylate kinase
LDRTKIFVICGPPGVGKGTVLALLAREKELGLVRVLSVTTRPPGRGECDGIDYHFISPEEFAKLQKEGKILGGTTQFGGFKYGIRIHDIIEARRHGKNVLMESNLKGVSLLKATFHGVVAIFLCPPSISELHRRLIMRGRDDLINIKLRIEEGQRMMQSVKEYPIDYFVVNDNLERCIAELKAIILKEIRYH